MVQSADVAIVDDGMVGLAIACGLQGSGLRVAILEQYVSQPLVANAPPQLRVLATNAASEELLTRLGVWSDIAARRTCCYHGMEAWDKDSLRRIILDDQDMGYSRLGYTVENSEIHYTLQQKAQCSTGITMMAPVEVQRVTWGENEAFLDLEDGAILTACLVVGADDVDSRLRNKMDIPLILWDYRHHALVVAIRTQETRGAAVRQAFHGEEILASLPLSDPYLCSIVWSPSPQEAERMQQASIDGFSQVLNITFDNRLELCSLESEHQVFPLTGCYARQLAAHRLALVGDAAHIIHPLTGQGANLGFMDATELIDELKWPQRQGKDIGQYLYLRRYKHSRKYSATLMLAGMQGLRELFADEDPAKKLLRNVGPKLADTLPGIKPQLICQAMGLNDFLEWLRQCLQEQS